jgi:hypothetical protein
MKSMMFLVTLLLMSSSVWADDAADFAKQEIARVKMEQKREAAKEKRAQREEFAHSTILSIQMDKGKNRRDRIENGKVIYVYIFVPYREVPRFRNRDWSLGDHYER